MNGPLDRSRSIEGVLSRQARATRTSPPRLRCAGSLDGRRSNQATHFHRRLRKMNLPPGINSLSRSTRLNSLLDELASRGLAQQVDRSIPHARNFATTMAALVAGLENFTRQRFLELDVWTDLARRRVARLSTVDVQYWRTHSMLRSEIGSWARALRSLQRFDKRGVKEKADARGHRQPRTLPEQ